MASAEGDQAAASDFAQLALEHPVQQLSEFISQCKEAVQQLRGSIQGATSHRAKCCEVLGAALTAILALDQAVHSSSWQYQSRSLQRLCGEVIAAVDLAQRRVQIFSSQPRLVKYAYLPNKRAVEGKLNHVIQQLETLTQKVWDLQAGSDAGDSEASASRASPSNNKSLELERVYTPRSVAAIQSALSDLHDKLASGNTQADQTFQTPLVSLQRGPLQHISHPQYHAPVENASTQTSPTSQLAQTVSFDSAQSHNQRRRTSLDKADARPGSATPSGTSFTAATDSPADPPASQLSPEVQRAPPPPSPGQDPAAQQAAETRRRPSADLVLEAAARRSSQSSQYSSEGDLGPSMTGGSSRSTYSPFEAAINSTASQHASQQLQMPNSSAQHGGQLTRPPSNLIDHAQQVSDWAMQAQLQADTTHASGLTFSRPADLGATQSLPILGVSMLRAQSHTPTTRPADQLHPALSPSPLVTRRTTDEPSRRQSSDKRRTSLDQRRSSDQQCSSSNWYREMYAPSVRSSSHEVFENLGCSVIPYEELEVKRKIGDGSIGQVYLGRWQQTDVAIKVLTEMQNLASKDEVTPQDPATLQPWEESDDDCPQQQGGEKRTYAKGLIGVSTSSSDGATVKADSTITTLEREVSIMASLRHPNVVMFMGLCLEPPCIVTEFCARGSLFDVLRKARSSPPFAQQMDWTRRLGMALDAAKGMLQLHSHKPPILHRDLKSPNMLVERHWRVKITDFNLSRMVHTGEQNASVTSLLANNPRWLAPEVVKEHDYSKAADVYSFGIIMWEMMTWRLPWEELNPFQIMLRLNQQDRPEVPPLDTLPGQPLPGITGYIQLMQECWDENPQNRPSFEHIIISVRGLMESAANQHKLQKTLTEVPRLGNATSAVPPNMNKLPVVGQTPFDAKGSAPMDTPTPLTPLNEKEPPIPLQVYKTERAFFGSAPVGGLEILFSAGVSDQQTGEKEKQQKASVSGAASQQAEGNARAKRLAVKRRHSWNGTGCGFSDVLSTAPSLLDHNKHHVASCGFHPKPTRNSEVKRA